MFHSLLTRVPLLRCSIREPHTQFFCFFQFNLLSTSPKRCSKSLKKLGDEHSYTVNYLTNTLGISSERAIKSCKYITLQSPEKPDLVISFLQKHGFSKAQISKMVELFPPLIMFDPEKTLLPKIEYFMSLGFSLTEVASILTFRPQLFGRSLEKQLMPSVRFLSCFLPNKEEMLASLKSYGDILGRNLEASLMPNIQYLKELGVPQSNISRILRTHPISVVWNHIEFRRIVDDVKEMGLNPKNYMFLYAICHIVSMSKATWEKKVHLYKSWGFTQEEIIQAFRIHPHFMAHSPQKIMDVMDYLVNNMGFKNSIVIERPILLCFSLQKRIIPRCSVYQILLDKKLLPSKFNVKQLLDCEEKKFLKKFVESFEKQVPELLMLYKRVQPASGSQKDRIV